METYLQTAWGDQWDNITLEIVRNAIEVLKKMDDEHGAFWVGLINNDENILEVHKNLHLIGTFEDEPEIQYESQGNDWNEIELFFQLFLSNKMDIVKLKLKENN